MTSIIKVDNIQDQDGNNIINENANTITVGASGDTIIIPSGATITNNGTQNGFGRTGTVDWQTSSIKTATFTAANGEGYFANTSSGGFTMNLPAGTAGNIVSVVDYTNTFQTNALTISPNGSQKIGGVNANFSATTEGQSLTFVYVDDTEGWKNIQDSTSNATGNPNLVATGGTITTCGNCKIHTFTGPGTFTVANAASCAANNVVSYLVIAGGGSGGAPDSGGGGAGGYRELKSPVTPYTASPLDGYPSAPNRVTITAQAYPITVGAGGSPVAVPPTSAGKGNDGSASTALGITSAGGGGRRANISPQPGNKGQNGGSGGGGGRDGNPGNGGGTGNTPPTSPAQGTNGGSSPEGGWHGGSGGGGATSAGANGGGSGSNPCTEFAGNGGNGATTNITGSPVTRTGGGGGSNAGNANPSRAGNGGPGGGGDGGIAQGPIARAAVAGTVNTGSGGGGDHGNPGASGAGGSGIVVIRYKFQ